MKPTTYQQVRGELSANLAAIEYVALYLLVFLGILVCPGLSLIRCIQDCATVSPPPPNQEDRYQHPQSLSVCRGFV